MPLIFAEGKIVLFAHVPKTGGSALEAALAARYGPLGLYAPVWSNGRVGRRTDFAAPPQHLSARDLACVIPPGRIDYCFAVVRHPVDRILSAYRHRATHGPRQARLVRAAGFSLWLQANLRALRQAPGISEGHLRPQVACVPEGAAVFRLEDGLDRPLAAVAHVLGPGAEAAPLGEVLRGDRTIPAELTADDLRAISDAYAEDFDRFGYPLPEIAGPRGSRLGAALARPLGWAMGAAYRAHLIG